MSCAAIACPACRYEFDLLAALEGEAERQALHALMTTVQPTVGTSLVRYTMLFRPPKSRLTFARQVVLLMQILPELQSQRVRWKGRELPVSPQDWRTAIEQMLEAAQTGRLALPVKNHNYLRAILAGMADLSEAAAAAEERQREADKRTAPRQGTVQVHGQTLPIGEALQVAYANKDPALAKLDADAQAAAPMPDSVRARFAQLKGKP